MILKRIFNKIGLYGLQDTKLVTGVSAAGVQTHRYAAVTISASLLFWTSPPRSGNFGDVYQAQLLTNLREVAVKTCRDPESFRDKFLEEADTLKKFKHKNVVKLLG